MKKATVIGHFGGQHNFLDGQTIKTKILTTELERRFGAERIGKVDTHGGRKKLLLIPFILWKVLRNSENVVILPAHNGLRVIAPILAIENVFFHRKLHYVVIGGWLPEYLKKHIAVAKKLKKFFGIYVETNTMKKALEDAGYTNILMMPNCKDLKILDESELVYPLGEPYKLCTFSRVMKEKGIEDAVNAVKAVNEQFGRTVYTLDIYGQVDIRQAEWFDVLQKTFPEYVRYGGLVPFDKSVEVVKDYFALLFLTYYEGEGFAGTVIDAFASGVPVIASDWKYNCEIVEDGVTGIIVPTRTPMPIITNLCEIALHPDRWTAIKTICLAKAKEYLPKRALNVLVNEL